MRCIYLNNSREDDVDLHQACNLLGQGLFGILGWSSFHLFEPNPGSAYNLSTSELL